MSEWQEDWPTLPDRYLDLIVAEGMSRMNAAVERVIASCETHQIEVKPEKVDTWSEDSFSRRLEIQRWFSMGNAVLREYAILELKYSAPQQLQ